MKKNTTLSPYHQMFITLILSAFLGYAMYQKNPASFEFFSNLFKEEIQSASQNIEAQTAGSTVSTS